MNNRLRLTIDCTSSNFAGTLTQRLRQKVGTLTRRGGLAGVKAGTLTWRDGLVAIKAATTCDNYNLNISNVTTHENDNVNNSTLLGLASHLGKVRLTSANFLDMFSNIFWTSSANLL